MERDHRTQAALAQPSPVLFVLASDTTTAEPLRVYPVLSRQPAPTLHLQLLVSLSESTLTSSHTPETTKTLLLTD